MRSLMLFLLCACTAFAQQADDAKAEYEKFEKAFKAEREAYSARRKAATSTDEYKSALKTYRSSERGSDAHKEALNKLRKIMGDVANIDIGAYEKKALAAADKYSGTNGEVRFLVWLVTRGINQKKVAFERLNPHAGSADIDELLDFLQYPNRAGVDIELVRSFLGEVITKNQSNAIKASAYYARSQSYVTRGRNPKPMAGFEEKYLADRNAVLKLAPNSLAAMRIQAPEFVKTRLQIGMKAPDIKGADLDGVDFKLSDYMGKVVVLDFWGDW